MRLTQKQLNLWLAKWQAMLRLQDWDIVIVLVDRKDIDGDDAHWVERTGSMKSTHLSKIAKRKVLSVQHRRSRPGTKRWCTNCFT